MQELIEPPKREIMKEPRKTFFIIFSLVGLSLAWVGSAPPLAAQEIEVTSADPAEAEQDTINLDVTIRGKGFDRSAKVKFFLTGTTNPGGVRVNSTRFVGSTELVANIDVAVDAVVATRDIVVQARKGRTGKGTELFSVLEKGSGLPSEALARATFRDFAVDRIQSDGVVLPFSCSVDYADFDDPCYPGHPGVSRILNTGDYFLRTLHNHVPNPTRWLVLDFSEGLEGSHCLNLDLQLANDPERNPDAFVPVDPDPCMDFLEVRFSAGGVFATSAQYSEVSLVIDKPVWLQGRGKNKESYNQWNGQWYLNLVNPLTITRDPSDPNTVILTTMDGLEQAELWTIHEKTGKHETLLGTYRMPFEITIARVPQQD
jgi:hypothetical protein